jgi:hypothetical protein
MASIVPPSKYGEGHEVVLSAGKGLSFAAKSQLSKMGYTLSGGTGEPSVFSIVRDVSRIQLAGGIQLSTGTATVYLKDSSGKVIAFKGSKQTIEALFNHYAKEGKSATNDQTRIKEEISMWMIEAAVERGQYLTEDAVYTKLSTTDKKLYRTVYYESALKQAKAIKPIIKTSGYTYERQLQDKTAKLYENARRLSKKQNDNWNPADIWMIKKTYPIQDLYTIDNLGQLNDAIAQAYKNQDIIPISLKQITAEKAHLDVVAPVSAMQAKLDIDFTLNNVSLSETFANFQIETASRFSVRGGFKGSGTTYTVSLEGKMKGAGYQLGAVDAKDYPPRVKEEYNYTLRNGVRVTEQGKKDALEELKEIYNKYPGVSSRMPTYTDAVNKFHLSDPAIQARASNLISFLYSFLIAPKTKEDFKNNMKFCYYSSRKMSSHSSMYVVLK